MVLVFLDYLEMIKKWCLLVSFSYFIIACEDNGINTYVPYAPTPAPLEIPQLFADNIIDPVIPFDNPQTVEGIALGRKLFFDPILSGDNTKSCSDCHAPEAAFSDQNRFSEGIDGLLGSRNSMPIFNLAWNYDELFFWDGHAFSLENQAFEPVVSPIEMHSDWQINADKLNGHPEYPELFRKVFGEIEIDSILVTKALAQFQRTLISANSRFDQYLLGDLNLSAEEMEGFNVFMDETRGDCFHCHGNQFNPLWTDNLFHNNGLDSNFSDLGLGEHTGNPEDNGKFRTPSLRNLAFTAPYMHDGRFTTLDEVINHYSEGLQNSPTIDPLMKSVHEGGVQLTPDDKAALKAFLLSLSDESFINNPNFQNPNP
ncbi:cytochrome-c peroxidase [Urechidicola sp. KH5]